ncbi:MAG: CFI-box-CTERM domain-containing protein [Mycoplasmatota bacterium]
MSKTCSECNNLCKTDSYGPDLYGYFWCDRKREKTLANQDECRHFTEHPTRTTSEAQETYKLSVDKNKPSSCFITTICCEILGLSDNCAYLQCLRSFRDGYMSRSNKGLNSLYMYDSVGPLIADYIKRQENQKDVASNMFYGYILPAFNAICDGNDELAQDIYTQMVNSLMNKEFLNAPSLLLQVEEPRIVKTKTLGHARI